MAWITTALRNPNRAPVDKKRRLKLLKSYLPDWVITIGLWAAFYALDKIIGYRRLFDITDTSLHHPFSEHERVPVWALSLIGGVFPLLVVWFTAALFSRSFWDAHNGTLGLALSLGLTVTFTDIIKITVGRPRPDFISRCAPPSSLTANPTPFTLTSWTVCTRTDLLNDGFRSFPSGHSSFAWCGMIYLLLFLSGKFHIYNTQGYTYKSWLLLIPLSAAALVSVSRTMDYRHHATDVIAGAIIGILAAWYSYRQFYPSIAHPQSHKPYSPRIPRDEAGQALPLHNTVSEEQPLTNMSLNGGQEGLNGRKVGGGEGVVNGGGHGMGGINGQGQGVVESRV